VTTTGPSDTGTAAPGSVRARVVIVRDDVLALIERHRDGPIYSAFPRGAAEPGETPEAAARKAYEEPGLRVAISAALAEAVVDGTPGIGRGAEWGASTRPRGTYRAVWLPLAALARLTVYPRVMADLIVTGVARGWPAAPLRLHEPAPRACRSGNRHHSPFTPPHAAGYTISPTALRRVMMKEGGGAIVRR